MTPVMNPADIGVQMEVETIHWGSTQSEPLMEIYDPGTTVDTYEWAEGQVKGCVKAPAAWVAEETKGN